MSAPPKHCTCCGKRRRRSAPWIYVCVECKHERRRLAVLRRSLDGYPKPVDGHEERIAKYRQLVEAGIRLFEPTPERQEDVA